MWNRLETLCVDPLGCVNWAFAWTLIRVSVTLLKYRLIKASILTSSSAGLCAVLTLTHQLPVQRTTDTLQVLLPAQRVKRCYNCTLDTTPVVGDMCRWGWNCEGVPELWVTWGTLSSAVHTFTQQIRQLSGKGTMTSCLYIIMVIKNWSPWSFRVTVVVCLAEVTPGQQRRQTARSRAPVSAFLFVQQEQLLCCLCTRPLCPRLCCFSLVFRSAGQWFSGKRTVAGFVVLSCFPLEISPRAQWGQCVCRSGREDCEGWRSGGQERRGPKTCWLHGCLLGQTAR